jgi:serine protease Do
MINGTIHRHLNWVKLGLVGLGVLLVGLIAGSALSAKGWLPFGSDRVPIYPTADQRVVQAVNLNMGFSSVAKAVMPAVVTIETSARVRPRQRPYPFNDPFGGLFDWAFPQDDQPPRSRAPRQPAPRGHLQQTALGSGVIVSPEGLIITNNHVVEGAEKVDVILTDNRHYLAKVVGTDAPSDVAVLKIDARDLPSLQLGDSNKVEVGDVVLAVGNPLGIGQTVTMGIISAKGRSTSAGSGNYEDFLQTDAAINEGNSGGALVNLNGEMIGIPSQIVSQTGGNIGIGFAIPSSMARNVMDQLVGGGRVHRGKLGVSIGALTPELAEHFGYKGAQGALVQDVERGQPAELAGVKPGDIITEYQGQRVVGATQLHNLVAQTAPGSTVRFKVWRDGAERELTATLTEMSLPLTGGKGGGGPGSGGGGLAGVSVENLTPEIARQLSLPPATRGVVVNDIDSDSNAAGVGLRSGDVIEEVDRQPVSSVNEFRAALQRAGKKDVLLRVRRTQQGAFYLVVPAQE